MSNRDWNKDWEIEQKELDDLLASLAEFNACEHEWVPDPEAQAIGLDEMCTKCGGGRTIVTEDEFNQISTLLEESRARED